MYKNLQGIGVSNPTSIERYSLRQEANHDIIKIYFHKQRGELFARSMKLKFPRQRKTVLVDGGRGTYKDVSEINTNLRFIVEELDQLTKREQVEHDLKAEILRDLRHLEKVVSNKMKEIEVKLERLNE